MDSQNNREQLLARWAELAPQECDITTRYSEPPISIWRLNRRGHFDESAAVFPALLLSALIEAVRARGWHSVIWNDDEAFAHVKRADSELLGKAAGYQPCDALLAAYVRALEATCQTELKS